MKLRLLATALFLVFSGPISHSADADSNYFFTPEPSAIPEVLAAIGGAKTSIHMMMYHLSEPTIIEALIAAKKRGVDVQVLLDQQTVAREKPTGAFHALTAADVKVIKSSTGFSISHYKTFVVDGTTAYVMTLNLTRITNQVRDVAYITRDKDTVKFLEDLFALDVANGADQGVAAPKMIPDNIVLSPVNSRARLQALIKTATKRIQLEVENFSDTALANDLIEAKKVGITVEVLVPRCNMGAADFNMPIAKQLAQGKVDVRLMPDPSTTATPYIHQKSIVVDGERAFLGSENFSFNSLDHARELGIIISDRPVVQKMMEVFVSDFNQGLNITQAEAFTCPVKTFSVDTAEAI